MEKYIQSILTACQSIQALLNSPLTKEQAMAINGQMEAMKQIESDIWDCAQTMVDRSQPEADQLA